ncbi:MAG: hypothetical protein LBH00_11935, partial [Planctomycetaceae bacterium]|nr:hypothetical protein [Planctomycetaceae bacterium]
LKKAKTKVPARKKTVRQDESSAVVERGNAEVAPDNLHYDFFPEILNIPYPYPQKTFPFRVKMFFFPSSRELPKILIRKCRKG